MLDVLAGRKTGQGVTGAITLNNHVMTKKLSNRCISYVGQEDVFMPTLSAWESLLFVSPAVHGANPQSRAHCTHECCAGADGPLQSQVLEGGDPGFSSKQVDH